MQFIVLVLLQRYPGVIRTELKDSGNTSPSSKLTHTDMGKLEVEFGVFIMTPANPSRSPNEQFGIYDKNRRHAEDITASGKYFTVNELRNKIDDICKRLGK